MFLGCPCFIYPIPMFVTRKLFFTSKVTILRKMDWFARNVKVHFCRRTSSKKLIYEGMFLFEFNLLGNCIQEQRLLSQKCRILLNGEYLFKILPFLSFFRTENKMKNPVRLIARVWCVPHKNENIAPLMNNIVLGLHKAPQEDFELDEKLWSSINQESLASKQNKVKGKHLWCLPL